MLYAGRCKLTSVCLSMQSGTAWLKRVCMGRCSGFGNRSRSIAMLLSMASTNSDVKVAEDMQ